MMKSLYAVKTWSCPRCGENCQEVELHWPAIEDHGGKIRLMACVGMSCDLVFATSNGMWLGHEIGGVYVPATEHELIHGPA